MKNFTRIFAAALLAGLFTTASAQQKEYLDGIFMLNEGWFGTETGSVNFLNNRGEWEYRVGTTQEGEPMQLGATGCFATINDGKMYIVSKKNSMKDASVVDPSLTVCDAKTMTVLAQVNNIATEGNAVAADGRSFLAVEELGKAYVSTTNGVYTFDLKTNTVGQLVEGTDGLTNNQAGNMLYRDGKLYAVDNSRGLLIIDTGTDKLVKALHDADANNTYASIVEAKDGSVWLSVANATTGDPVQKLVKFNPADETLTDVTLPADVKAPGNSIFAWNPDCFTASAVENALFWQGVTGDWGASQAIYRYDIDANECKLFIDFTQDEVQPYMYGAACRVNPETGYLYLGIIKGSPWGDESELRIYSRDAALKASYPMEKHYWYPEMPVFSLRGYNNGIASLENRGSVSEVARYTVDGKRIARPQKGLNIVKYSDGTVKKILVK